jgi:hypothetical protein
MPHRFVVLIWTLPLLLGVATALVRLLLARDRALLPQATVPNVPNSTYARIPACQHAVSLFTRDAMAKSGISRRARRSYELPVQAELADAVEGQIEEDLSRGSRHRSGGCGDCRIKRTIYAPPVGSSLRWERSQTRSN